MKLNKSLIIAFFIIFAASAAANPDVSVNNLPDSATLQDGIDIEGSAGGENLDEISIRMRDPGDNLWTSIETKNCEGLNDCSIDLFDYSPNNAVEKEFSVFVDNGNGEGNHTEPQTVQFTDGTSEAQLEVSMDNLDSQAPADEDFNFDVTASGENLDTLTVEYREEGGDWETLDSKNCEGLPDCHFNPVTYTPTEAQEVDFRANIEEESGDKDETNPQTVQFIEGEDIEIRDVRSTNQQIERGENTRFRAEIHANRDFNDPVSVRFRVNGEEYLTDWYSDTIEYGETVTVSTREELSWYELEEDLQTGQEYDLELRVSEAVGNDLEFSEIEENAFRLDEGNFDECHRFTDSGVDASISGISGGTISEDEEINPEAEIRNNADTVIGGSNSGDLLIYFKTTEEQFDCEFYRNEFSSNAEEYTIGWDGVDVPELNPGESHSESIFAYNDKPDELEYDEIYNPVGVFHNGSKVYVGLVGTIMWTQENQDEPSITLDANQPLNAVNVQTPVEIDWSVDNPNNVDLTYSLNVEDEDGDQVFSEDNIDQTSYSLEEDLGEGTYTWTVEAVDNDGDVRADADGSFELNNAYIDGVTMNDLPNQQETGEDMEIEASASGRDLQELMIKQRVHNDWNTYHEKDCGGMPDCSIDLPDYSRSSEGEVDYKAVAIAGTGNNEEEQESDVQTVEFVDEIYLEADFDYHPENPEVGETVEFESESSGDIEEWTWDFGDGETASGQNVEHEFDEADNYPVELTVSDGENEDDETKIVEVGSEADDCDIDVGDIEFDPEYVQQGEDSTISITVENNGDRQDIEVEFQVNDYRESIEDDTLESGEEEEYSITISRDNDAEIIATVTTLASQNNPCQTTETSRFGTLQVVQDGENDATFNFDVEDEVGEPLEDVTIQGENGDDFTRYTDDDGEATANIESGTYEITASKPGYDSETKTRTVDSGETINVDFELERDESAENEGQLSVLTEDLDGERLEDVEITAENGDDETEYTDDDGRAFIYLEEGDYTVTAEKDGYLDQARDVEIEAGDRTPVLFDMVSEDEDSIRITDLEYEDTVCRGDTLSVVVSIRNSRDSDEIVTMRTEGLGTDTDREVVTDRGDTITREVLLTNVEGSGTEQFTVSIENSVYDEETGEVEVEDCGTTDQPDAEATGLTAEVNPRTIQAGETVNIRGFVDGIRGATEVEFESNGDQIASTSTDRSGYYSTYVRFNTPRTKSIDISAGGLTRTRNVEVLATATVGGITAPRQVFESESFEICADVSSQVDADVVLLRNGDVVESKTGVGEVCFETEAGAPGTAIYEVRALTSGSGGSSTRAVQVLEQGNEVESFPGQLASVESGGSITRVELYNTNDDLKSYDIELTGIDDRWYTQSDETVQLRSGERETVYIYLTPRAEGEYRPLLSVSSEGSTIYSQEIILETEGTTDSNPPGFFQRLFRFLGI